AGAGRAVLRGAAGELGGGFFRVCKSIRAPAFLSLATGALLAGVRGRQELETRPARPSAAGAPIALRCSVLEKLSRPPPPAVAQVSCHSSPSGFSGGWIQRHELLAMSFHLYLLILFAYIVIASYDCPLVVFMIFIFANLSFFDTLSQSVCLHFKVCSFCLLHRDAIV